MPLPTFDYDARRMMLDLNGRSVAWLAKRAHVSTRQAFRFLSGSVQTQRMCVKLARALKHEPERYILGVGKK
jgi:hypothetical protein